VELITVCPVIVPDLLASKSYPGANAQGTAVNLQTVQQARDIYGIDIAYYCKINVMNVKRTFGTILTVLGIIGLIYAGYGYTQKDPATRQLIVYGIVGLIFFFSGIGLVKNTKDEA
jgi:uncharacterized membrane protein